MRRALAIDEKSFGPDHLNVVRDLNHLAAILQATNRLDESAVLMHRVTSILKDSLGEHHPSTRLALANLEKITAHIQENHT